MTSFRQIEANRRNARKSTGAITEEGTQRSRCNAVRHGLAAETVISALEDGKITKHSKLPLLRIMMRDRPWGGSWCYGWPVRSGDCGARRPDPESPIVGGSAALRRPIYRTLPDRSICHNNGIIATALLCP